MLKISSRKIVISAMAAAVVFLVTWTVRIPIASSGGYVNLGDVVIYMSAYLFGGPIAAAAAAVGSALADTAAGAVVYIPATFVIKGIMALTAGHLCAGKKFASYCFACLFGGALMTGGYALYEMAVFGMAYALVSIPYNLMQWAGSVIIAVIFFPALDRIGRLIRIDKDSR